MRNERRVLEGEAERLKFKASVAEEDRQKLHLKAEKKQAEVNACLLEKSQMQTLLRDKDLINENLQKQVTTLKADLAHADLGRADLIRKL